MGEMQPQQAHWGPHWDTGRRCSIKGCCLCMYVRMPPAWHFGNMLQLAL